MRRDRVQVTVHTAKCSGARIIMEQQIVKLPRAPEAEQQVMGMSRCLRARSMPHRSYRDVMLRLPQICSRAMLAKQARRRAADFMRGVQLRHC